MSSHRLDTFHIPTVLQGKVTNEYYQYIELTRGIEEGNVEAVKDFLNKRPDSVDQWINLYETPLLKACACGKTEIVKELLIRMTPEQMFPKMSQNKSYHTPLTIVAANGKWDIAEALIAKNQNVLVIPDLNGNIPVVVAVESSKKLMAKNLYIITPVQVLFDENGYHATKLLISAILNNNMLDIALDLFGMCKRLAITKHPQINMTPIITLASQPDLFEDVQNLGPLGRFIYPWIQVKLPTIREVEGEDDDNFQELVLTFWEITVPQSYNLKVRNLQVERLVLGISEETLGMGLGERGAVDEALRRAVISGNVQFLKQMMKNNPELLLSTEHSSSRELCILAIERRQTEVFKFLCRLTQKHLLRDGDWQSGTGVLDLVSLAPKDKLATISGAVAQLQSELEWFSEIVDITLKIGSDKSSTLKDNPFELFKQSHEPLRKEAETSIKSMAGSYSLVAILIVTVTFAAVFTVPGGTDDDNKGKPFHLGERLFNIFIVSDMISCLSASTSVLIFLGILTSRYHFMDFKVSLPRKMIVGLLFLFVSIAAMLTALWSALFTMLNKTSLSIVPVVLVASFPAILFLKNQYPLFREMIVSTFSIQTLVWTILVIIYFIFVAMFIPLMMIYIIVGFLSSIFKYLLCRIRNK